MEPAVILFDGVCNFCNAGVNFVIRHDKRDRFRFAPLQSPVAAALLEKAGLDQGKMDTFVLLDEGAVYVKSGAGLRVLKQLGFPWSMAWILIILPKPLRDAMYNWIVRNRYRWFGKREECMVPDAQVRRKFL